MQVSLQIFRYILPLQKSTGHCSELVTIASIWKYWLFFTITITTKTYEIVVNVQQGTICRRGPTPSAKWEPRLLKTL